MTEDSKAKILSQVEFYFSDSNLVSDRFLWKTSQANDGWVPISTISQFERMKKYRPVETIVEALKESKELLEVSENNELVRRKTALPSNQHEIKALIDKRSVVVQNFPEDATLDDLIQFFKGFGPTNQIRMKKKDKKFEGSVIVEFRTPEDATKFLEIDPKPKYAEKELTVISKVSFDESRANKFGQRRGFKGKKNNNNGRGRGRDSDRDNKESSAAESEEKSASTADEKKRDASPKRSEEEKSDRVDRDE